MTTDMQKIFDASRDAAWDAARDAAWAAALAAIAQQNKGTV